MCFTSYRPVEQPDLLYDWGLPGDMAMQTAGENLAAAYSGQMYQPTDGATSLLYLQYCIRLCYVDDPNAQRLGPASTAEEEIGPRRYLRDWCIGLHCECGTNDLSGPKNATNYPRWNVDMVSLESLLNGGTYVWNYLWLFATATGLLQVFVR